MSLILIRTPEIGLNFDSFTEIARKIEKSKHFINIENGSDSPINSFSNDI